jgi:capsular exopolysaccharide synthesis family protein
MPMDVPPIEPEHTQEQPEQNQFRFIYNVLSMYAGWILASTLLGVGIALVFTLLSYSVTMPRFAAYADLLVKQSQWEKEVLTSLGSTPLFTFSPDRLIESTSHRALAEETARALVQSHVARGGLLSSIVGDEAIQAKASEIQGKIALTSLPNSQLVRVEVNHCASQDEANEIAEFAARAFLEMTQAKRFELEEQERLKLDTQLGSLGERLNEAEQAVWQFQKQLGFKSASKIYDEMGAKEEELQEIRVTKGQLAAKLLELESELTTTSDQLPVALDQPTEEVVTRLFQELDELLKEKLKLSAIYQPQHPDMVMTEERIAEQQQVIMDTVAELDRGIAGGSSVWRRRQDLYRQQVDMRLQLASLEIRESTLGKMLDGLINDIPDLANKHLEYQRLVANKDNVSKELERKLEQRWQIANAANNERGQVLRHDPVSAISVPYNVGGRSWMNLVIGGIVGFLLAFGACMMAEMNDTSIRTVEDVVAAVSHEVIGTIPKMRFGTPRGFFKSKRATYVSTVDEEQIDSCIVTQHDPKSPISEAYRALRTNFQFATLGTNAKTLMVTSAVPGEGKTTTVVNLAVTMADQGMRVLVVDTDLRRPNVHRVLRMERGPGLADVLREGLDLDMVIRPTRVENLWVISAGRVPPNPSELIGSERMAEVMHTLRGQFDLVICDAPSVLVVTDPVLLATKIDTCLLVCAAGFARRETVSRASKLLSTAKGRIAGVVLNNLETTRRNYYYYYYYYEEGGGAVRRKWRNFF